MSRRDIPEGISVGGSFNSPAIGVVTGCIWINGIHAYCETSNCPEAETNNNIGWTVQQADAKARLYSELAKKGNSDASRQE